MERYNKRLIKILRFFLENEKWITGASIALSVGVSTRTVRNDIKELNQMLADRGAEITSEIGQGYKLTVSDSRKFDLLKRREFKALSEYHSLGFRGTGSLYYFQTFAEFSEQRGEDRLL